MAEISRKSEVRAKRGLLLALGGMVAADIYFESTIQHLSGTLPTAWLVAIRCFAVAAAGRLLYEMGLAVARVRMTELRANLRASEERHRAFVENSPDPIWRIELEQPLDQSLPI